MANMDPNGTIFKKLSDFFSAPGKPLTIEEVNALTAAEVAELYVVALSNDAIRERKENPLG